MSVKEEERKDSTDEDFPAGLKVLLVDDDPLCLKVIGQMLKCCKYEGELADPLMLFSSCKGQTVAHWTHSMMLVLSAQI